MDEGVRTEKIFRGTSVQRFLRNYDSEEEIFSRAPPARRAYDDEEKDIPRLVPTDMYLTSSPTRAASYSRSMPKENEIPAVDWPIIMELEAEEAEVEEYFKTSEWDQRGITDYTTAEFPADMVSTVYVLDDETLGEQLPSEETVDLSDHQRWHFQEYDAFLEMFSEIPDSSEILEQE